MKYLAGFDIGSDSIQAVVLNEKLKIIKVFDPSTHFGSPILTLKDIYSEIIDEFGYENIVTTAITGSAGEHLAQGVKVPFFHDTTTIPTGVSFVEPKAEYIFHIGAKDSYFFALESLSERGETEKFVADHSTGTKCGGGSGILVTKQCRRFFEKDFKIEIKGDRKSDRKLMEGQLQNIFKKAEEEIAKVDKKINVGGRCGVVIQSDMIHLQNSGETIKNILEGMYRRIIKNYKSDVIRTRKLEPKKAVVTGGVFANPCLIKFLEEELKIKIEAAEHFRQVGALGAVIKAKDTKQKFHPKDLADLIKAEKSSFEFAPPLSSALDKLEIYEEVSGSYKKENLTIYDIYSQVESRNGENGGGKKQEDHVRGQKINAVLGVDGGSTTTKAIVASLDGPNSKTGSQILAEICIYTNGNPLAAAQEVFRQIDEHLGAKIEIKGVGYTGSSGSFYHKLFTDHKKEPSLKNVDLVKDEITCHALGVKRFNKKVDTIFELGGQDAKFTFFNPNGTVKKAKMNLSCMAGTGQTMQNMVEMIGLDIKETFHEYALRAKRTPIVDETCGIFTEAGIAKLIALGFPKEEIAAAIAYGFMGGYVNKFVGNEKFGDYASAQGGPFNGKSCLAALALHTGVKVHAFPHRQLFGALGAALSAAKRIKLLQKKSIPFTSKFRGLKVWKMEFEKKVDNCKEVISDTCGLRDCKLQIYKVGNEEIYSGGLCPKGNTEIIGLKAPDYVSLYNKILEKHLSRYKKELDKPGKRTRILIPRSLTFLNEKGVFYTSLYRYLGFEVAVSPASNEKITELGLKHSHSEICFPMKLAYGHGAYLKKYKRKQDKVLFVNPLLVGDERRKFCPYVSGAGFMVKESLRISNKDALLPVLYFENKKHPVEEGIFKDLDRVFPGKFTLQEVSAAVKKSEKAEAEFLNEIFTTGEKIIDRLRKSKEKIFLGVGRGYTVLDEKVSSNVHELFAKNGLNFLPALFIRPPKFSIEEIAENMYWYQGERMIKYTILSAIKPDLYPVRETNFNCGADSFTLYHEEGIMHKAKNPHLVLQTDGHNSNSQFGTRVLANNEVVKKHKATPIKIDDLKKTLPLVNLRGKLIGIPYMGDSSYAMKASFKSLGLSAVVIPTRNKSSKRIAKKLVSANTCLPFSFQVGDTLAWLYKLKKKGADPNKKVIILEPKAKGPCRFGQYHAILRKFFDDYGFKEVPILAPDGDEDYNNVPVNKWELIKLSTIFYKGSFCTDLLQKALLRSRPYEKEAGSVEKEYYKILKELLKLIEARASMDKLARFMNKARARFEKLIDPKIEQKPLVLMNGEIFVRCHPLSNQESIKLLEKFGLEVVFDVPSTWFEYVNKSSIDVYRKAKDWKRWLAAVIKRQFITRVSKKLGKPFENFLKGREIHGVEEVLNTAQDNLVFEKSIGGESVLSIGEALLFAQGHYSKISGIYHVGPFGCMHETAATSQIQAIVQRKRSKSSKANERILPILDGVFGDSELPNLEAEIALFAQKCYLKQRLNSENN